MFAGTLVAVLVVVTLSVWTRHLPSSEALVGASGVSDTSPSSDGHGPQSIPGHTNAQEGKVTYFAGPSALDDARLNAFRANSAAEALVHARRLAVDDSGRLALLLAIAGICRPMETSDRTAYIADAVQQGWLPDTAKQRQLLEAWWAAMVRYCADVVSSQVRAEAEQSLAARKARTDLLLAGRQQIDLAELAPRDPEELFLLLDQVDLSSGDDAKSQLVEAGISDALWSIFLTSPNPELALQAGTALSGLRDGVFAATRKLVPVDPSDPRLWDGNAFHGNSRPSSREIKVWEAAVEVFVCRTAAVCGPATARGLSRRPISELQLAIGSEGYWRSTLSPLEWDAVEAVVQQLEAERQSSRGG